MGKDAGASGSPSSEDLPAFLGLWQHVKRLQAGTPLLLRTVNNGQEDLQICTFSISQDMKMLRWQDQEGSGETHEAPVGDIVDIQEDINNSSAPPGGDEEDGHHALIIKSRRGGNEVTMYLICASPEDLGSWRDGLRFLVKSSGPASAPAPVRAGGSCAPRVKAVPTSPSNSSAAGLVAASPKASPKGAQSAGGQADAALKAELAKQREVNARLLADNGKLQELVKRKDATIAELMRELQSRAEGRCGKTESTSRESDFHLRDREVTVLQRKNQRLRKAMQAKQQTITELLKIVGKVSAQQGAESSAVEDLGHDDEDSDAADAAASNAQGVLAAIAGAAVNAGKAKPPAAAAAAPVSALRSSLRAPVVDTGGDADDDDEDEEEEEEESEEEGEENHEANARELEALVGQLASLQRDVAGLSNFQPPPRQNGAPPGAAAALMAAMTGASGGAAAKAKAKAPAMAPGAQALLAAALAGRTPGAARPQPPQPPPAAPAAAGPAAGSPGSAAALQALERELALLEEKKRVVERLARNLEPPSDGEEDDGFPLR